MKERIPLSFIAISSAGGATPHLVLKPPADAMGFGSKKPPPPAAGANKDAEDPAAGLAHLAAATACVAESTVILKTQATNLDLPPETMLAPVGQAVPFESLSDFKCAPPHPARAHCPRRKIRPPLIARGPRYVWPSRAPTLPRRP